MKMTNMYKRISVPLAGIAFLTAIFTGCTPQLVSKNENADTPSSYITSRDTTNSAKIQWRDYFNDANLASLIDTALQNNQELNITMREIEISRNEVRARKGEYLPFVNLGAIAETDKPGRYTSKGSSEATTEIEPGKETPDPLPNYGVGAFASWELDIWRKLRNAKKAAYIRYLSSVEGKNFVVTNLVAEIASSYYELLALDNELAIVRQNIEIQSTALEVVRHQKQAARVTELAVRRFEAQLFGTRSFQFNIQQRITETENRINFLVGRFPQTVRRDADAFNKLIPATFQAGIPSQLLENRPDIRKAEFDLEASRLDVNVARARFYPSLGIRAGIGFQAFNPAYLLTTPESMAYSLAGELTGPLINRNAIKATYYNANAKQIQAVFNYERAILNAYIEVANQLSNINNLEQNYSLRAQQVQALNESITISSNLFTSARADYMEVLLTQRDALDSKFELIETRKQQMIAVVSIYHALGGGWK